MLPLPRTQPLGTFLTLSCPGLPNCLFLASHPGPDFLPRASFFGNTSFFTLQSFPYLVNGDAEEWSLDRKLAELGLDPRSFTIILHRLTYRWGWPTPLSDPQLYSSIK